MFPKMNFSFDRASIVPSSAQSIFVLTNVTIKMYLIACV